jgi:hypothetical protein
VRRIRNSLGSRARPQVLCETPEDRILGYLTHPQPCRGEPREDSPLGAGAALTRLGFGSAALPSHVQFVQNYRFVQPPRRVNFWRSSAGSPTFH